MDHADHEPGSMDECQECRALAYEPGWYRSLREERIVAESHERVVVPDIEEPGDVEVVIAEIPARPDIEVLDLETAERDER